MLNVCTGIKVSVCLYTAVPIDVNKTDGCTHLSFSINFNTVHEEEEEQQTYLLVEVFSLQLQHNGPVVLDLLRCDLHTNNTTCLTLSVDHCVVGEDIGDAFKSIQQRRILTVHTVMDPFPAGLPFFSCRGLVRVLLETI